MTNRRVFDSAAIACPGGSKQGHHSAYGLRRTCKGTGADGSRVRQAHHLPIAWTQEFPSHVDAPARVRGGHRIGGPTTNAPSARRMSGACGSGGQMGTPSRPHGRDDDRQGLKRSPRTATVMLVGFGMPVRPRRRSEMTATRQLREHRRFRRAHLRLHFRRRRHRRRFCRHRLLRLRPLRSAQLHR